MKCRWAIVLIAVVSLSACGSGGDASREPVNDPTLPPGGAFKDGLLYAAIKAKLAAMDIDSTTRVSVSIHGGHVVLSGNVKDRATKERDVAIVRGIRGVEAIDDELKTGHAGPSASATVTDAALVAAVAGALAAQTGVNVAGVRIRAEAGTVTLAGHAPSAAIKSTMLVATRRTPGVRNVVDRIAVK